MIQSKAWDWDCRFVSISRTSQFVSISGWYCITYKLKHVNFKLFESILGMVTTLANGEKYWYFTLLKTFINWYVMHLLFLSMINVSHGNLRIFFYWFRALNACCNYIWLLYLSFYQINNKPEIETNWDWREISTNLQSQSQAFHCTSKHYAASQAERLYTLYISDTVRWLSKISSLIRTLNNNVL